MFSAIFGNFLFSRPAAPVIATPSCEASTQTSDMATTSTQTLPENELDISKQHNETPVVTCEQNTEVPAAAAVEPIVPLRQLDTSSDWVIVDGKSGDELTASTTQQSHVENKVEEVEQEAEQQIEIDEQPAQKVVEDDNDVLLGSFFERNAFADEQENIEVDYNEEEEEEEENDQVTQVPEPKKNETWLITPLPCLTSITSSQRSIVDNDPLENLLIEHPSMSVFVSATSSDVANDLPAQQAAQSSVVEDKQELDGADLSLLPLFYPILSTQQEEQTPVVVKTPVKERKQSLRSSSNGVQPPANIQAVIVKRAAEKRAARGQDSVSPPASPTSVESPQSTLPRRKDRKNKKLNSNGQSSSTSSINKENMQVKTLLMNEFKKACSNQSRQDSLFNKNQMKRNNKNATFSSTRNHANTKQRKYHKLQQPLFASNNFQF